ncbi:MAG TPA: STAS domain-containing protein [Phycisphaerae bacterium]|nr:STAS domain-containing protein [Phycisphaerae bacterium]
MEISIEQSKSYTVARVAGALSTEDAEQFIERMHPLVSERGSKVIVGLDQVTSISSSGLSALVSIATHARLAEGRVILVGPSKFVKGILEVTELDHWFEVCDDYAEAEQRLA